jgi:hypothetical protein
MSWLAAIWNGVMSGPRAFAGWVHAAFCALMDAEGRRAWAVVIAFGCGVSMTVYAGAALWLVRNNPMLAFWLGLGGLFIILVVITAFTGLLVKRDIGGSVSRDGGSFNITQRDEEEAKP